MPSHREQLRKFSFDFARRLADPAFRERLRKAGYTSGCNVLCTVPAEPVSSLLARIAATTKRGLIVAEDPDAAQGVRCVWFEERDTPPPLAVARIQAAA